MNLNKNASYNNRLINAKSPYLLQHAHNPVDWFEWGEEAWTKARKEDKLVLVSIGYAACHWCHVMEHETFMDENSAKLMNALFVCIKVDREERPDVDQIYMDAVQLISGHGGWPLNMFCLPDGRPLHGGTYFPNNNWNQVLLQLDDLYRNRKQEALDYAEKLTQGIKQMDAIKVSPKDGIQDTDFKEVYETWSKNFDWKDGGNNRSPKFPLPNNYAYLLNYGIITQNQQALDFVKLTLERMALGGLYDQLQGGFCRYSVDSYWFAPHFEKMLYDNAQLLGLYAKAYQWYGETLFKDIVYQTFDFLKDEFISPENVFYSALDADSDGEEGNYYVWTYAELENANLIDFTDFCAYYAVSKEGNWEHGKNILYAKHTLSNFCKLKQIEESRFAESLAKNKQRLLEIRGTRNKPFLDDKTILCWNALMVESLVTAYEVFQDERFKQQSEATLLILLEKLYDGEKLFRIYKAGHRGNEAFLEDYAALISALLAFYQISFDEKFLQLAESLSKNTLSNFYDAEDGLFYFTPKDGEPLIARKKDLSDDVISSSNAMMAQNLIKLNLIIDNEQYKNIAEKMLKALSGQFIKFAAWYSGWGQAYLMQHYGFIQIIGNGNTMKEIQQSYALKHPFVFRAYAPKHSDLALFKERDSGVDAVYICIGQTCLLPKDSFLEAWAQTPNSIKRFL